MTAETSAIRRTDHDRVAVLALDHPGRSMNVVDEGLLADLEREVDAALADPDVDALVLTSAKPGSFGAGADVGWLPELAARADAADFLGGVHALMARMVRAPEPLVAAVDGPAFGGALELALAARAIVATPAARLGLPEVTLGLLPGGGGTQLLGRFVGLEAAAELLTSGRRLRPDAARDLGLVAEVVDPEELVATAVARARALVGTDEAVVEVATADDPRTVLAARREALDAAPGGIAPAAAAILEVLEVGARDGLEAGLAAERAAFLDRLASAEVAAAVHLFQAEADVKRRSRGDGTTIARLGVVGGGQMGAGIAATAVSRDLAATVKDVDDEALGRARGMLDTVLARTAPPAGDDGDDPRVERWHGTTSYADLADADAVIEAVFELPELKAEVLGDLCAVVADDALLATNTSAIPIATLAAAVTHPERFLGMHFFSPVHRMPLVELIPHRGTAPATAARAAAVGRQLGKVPVVVGDAPGFFTSRVYARWLVEGVRLLLDGVPPGDVDAAAKAVGFPVGPLQAHDEATLELVLQASIGQVAARMMVERIDVDAVRDALTALTEAGVRGRRHGLGFHRYGDDGRRAGPNDEVLDLLGVTPRALDDPKDAEVVGERLLLAFATECYLCWDDGTLCHPDDGDVAAVLGIGFPRVLGGPFHHADASGAAAMVERCAALDPVAFPAGETLARAARDGGTFAGQPRRAAPFQPAGGRA